MKRLFKFLIVLVLCFSVTACSSSDSEKTTVTIWSTPLTTEFETMFNDEFLPEFNKKYPNIEVELEMLTWEGAASKLQTALTTKKTPDIYLDGTARTASLVGMDVLEPVTDIVNQHDDWFENVKTIGVKNGENYLVPATSMPCCSLSINVSLAKELGIDNMLPADRMSWDINDLYEFVKAASEKGKDKGISGIYLYAGSSTSDDALYSLLLSNGGNIIDFENNKCVANTKESVEVIEVLGNMVKNGYAMKGAATALGGDSQTAFLNRQYVVCLNMKSASLIKNQAQMVKDGYLDEVDEILSYGIPTADGITMNSASWGANCFALFKNEDENKVNAAKTVISEFINSKDISSTIWNAESTYSPTRDLGIEFESDDEIIKSEVKLVSDWVGQYGNSSFGILESYWAEIRNCFYPELQGVFTGDKTAQQAMDSFVENANKVLEKNK